MVGGGEGLRQGDNQVSSLVVDHISVHVPTHGVCCVYWSVGTQTPDGQLNQGCNLAKIYNIYIVIDS